MDILLYIIAALCVIIIIMLAALLLKKPKKDNSAELLSQKLDIGAKQSYDQMNYLSKQMQGLTEKITSSR